MHKLDNDVISNSYLFAGWRYYGRGANGHYDDNILKYGFTLSECVNWCIEKRAADGDTWNGIIYRHNKDCQCIKGDTEHVYGQDYVHFKTQATV